MADHNPSGYYVKLTYFRAYGKFAFSGSYVTKETELFEIWDEVEKMNDRGELPGAVPGYKASIISVKVPQHPHTHPHLIVAL